MKGTINQDAKTLESRANSIRVSAILKKYTMVIALVVVFIFFTALTGGKMLYAQNISNLLLQNAYVLVMGCGMLLCILTGGNVDLSVGATLCLVGAIAAQLMSNTSLNAVLVILICLAISAVIGTWQGFWIGYMHIPPFICTLAGMFLFRGLGRVVLESKTVSISNKLFLNIFSSYITVPGVDAGEIHWSAMIVGVVVAAVLLVRTITGRAKKARKGYAMDSAVSAFSKVILIDLLILFYCWKLANYKGIPVMLVWVLAFCCSTPSSPPRPHLAVTSTPWAATRRPPSSPVSIPGRSTSPLTAPCPYWQACLVCWSPPGLVPSTAIPVCLMRWTPSAPASSAAPPPTADPVRFPASWSAPFCWASSTRACPSTAWTTTGSMWSRALCC